MNHAQLEGRIADYMVNAGWAPALTEIDIGSVMGVDPAVHRRRGRMREPRWLADVAGMVRATDARLKKLGLRDFMKLAYELRSPGYEPPIWSWLIEVKVSRADFIDDPKFVATPEAHLQFVAYPEGLVRPDEVPDGWGGLEVCKRAVRKRMRGIIVNTPRIEQPAYLISAIARALWLRGGADEIARQDRERKQEVSSVR